MADNQKQSLFRKKSVEAIESPEVLDQYLRATSPSVWLVLAAIIALLVGGIVWSIFGTIDSKVQVAVVYNDEHKYCLVPQEALESVIENRVVQVGDETIELAPKAISPVTVAEDWDVYVLLAGNLQVGTIIYPIPISSQMEEGVYAGTIVTETISPISFIFN